MASTGLRSYRFPAGLRVLVVDTHACLKILERMLVRCKYQVTMCNLAKEALDLIEMKKDGFDIVMSDANVADMNDEFVQHVHRLQKNLPVIMMCVEDGETSCRVMKGVTIGACDYLVKPIRAKVLRNIWQHVVRSKIHELSSAEAKQTLEQILKSDADAGSCGGENKRKPNESAPHHPLKKPRVVWGNTLHDKFVDALRRIGLDKAGPKKILDLMGEPSLTRENVASHLQKYRLYLLRKQKEIDLKSFHGLQSGVNPNSLNLQHNLVANRNYVDPGHEHHIHEGGNVPGAMPLQQPMQQGEGENVVFGHSADNHSMSYINQHQHQHQHQPFELKDVAVKSESTLLAHYTWSGGAPPSFPPSHAFMPHFQTGHPYNHFPLVSHNPGHLYSKNRSYAIGAGNTTSFASNPQHSLLTHSQPYEPVEQNLLNDMESSFKSFLLGTGSAEAAAAAELNGYSSAADDMYLQNPHFGNIEPLDFINQEALMADVQPGAYDHDSQNFVDEYGSNQWTVK